MKKLILGLCIILAIASCKGGGGKKSADSAASTSATTSAKAADSVTKKVTLNGFPYDVAEKMEQAFFADSRSYRVQTDTWYDKKYIHQLLTLLNEENADGFRIYFARNTFLTNHKYNILLVSTHEKKIMVDGKSKTIHEDYFDHSATFLDTVKGKIAWGTSTSRGAVLYNRTTPCVVCASEDGHYISCDTAKSRIARMGKESTKSTINTSSEWFDTGLLYTLDSLLNKPGSKLDGVRLYFGKRYERNHVSLNTYAYRHGFVWVTTENGKDKSTCDTYFKKKEEYDNGEQCPNNCYGANWKPDSSQVAMNARKKK